MLAIERRREILARLTLHGKVIVSDLAREFDVTEETIRRDLDRLESEGLASKTYGGAVSKYNASLELPYTIREEVHIEEKQRIAALVADLIEDGERIMLDASSTALYVFRRLREKNAAMGIMMLTALSRETEKVEGLQSGADDYVTKPFSPSVLVARIDNLLRHDSINGKTLTVGEITVYDEAREVTVQGNHVELTPKEYELLKFLIKNKGKAFSREKLLNAVWSYDYVGDLRTVDTHVKQLRAKLGEDGDCIITVRNVGYKIVE